MVEKKSETHRDLIAELRESFAAERRLGVGFRPGRLEIGADGALIFEGEVERVAQKKMALEIAAAHPAIDAIVDRLRVRPAERLDDTDIRRRLREVYTLEPSLAGLSITEIDPEGQRVPLSRPDEASGAFEYAVSDGIITLNGKVSDLATKRLVGVLAWWNPGSRDVINGIVSASDETDGPDRMAGAVHTVLERDPYIEAGQIKVGVRGRVVRLTGWLPSTAQARMAENDAWYVFGVDNVLNEIETPG